MPKDQAPFADECQRRENGGISANDQTQTPEEAKKDNFSTFRKMTCSDQLSTGVMSYITDINRRRVFAVDEEMGLVFAYSIFVHDGRRKVMKIIGVPGITERKNDFGKSDLPAAHIFKIRNGKIYEIEAIGYVAKHGIKNGWAKDAKPALPASNEFSPDRRPTQAYEIYPKVHYVAFHYANPVTGRPVRYPPGGVTPVEVVKQWRNSSRTMPFVSENENFDAILTAVEHKLDAAIGVDAVENLSSSYGYYIDESAWDQMADTFASNGSKEITGVGVYVGRERIRKVLNLRGPRGGRTADFFTIHQLTQPVIHISEDGNSAKARLRLFQCGGNADGSSGSWIGGIYENTAVRENGEWKFGVQDLHHIYNASYRNEWARAGAAASAKAQPSRPPTGRDVPGG